MQHTTEKYGSRGEGQEMSGLVFLHLLPSKNHPTVCYKLTTNV